MRRFAFVVGVVVVLALPPPASAVQEPPLPERLPVLCANNLLEWLTDQPQHPYDPTFHVGLATWFMGCTYNLPPSVGPILNAMRADIETIDRHREALRDAEARHRGIVCLSWAAIYSSTYALTLYEYGSGPLYGLPTPDVHESACDTWVSGEGR